MNAASLSAADRLDQALQGAWKKHVPLDRPAPQPSSAWPQANLELLEQYQVWLASSGTGLQVIHRLYLPAAGYVLGLALKPSAEWDLEVEFQRAHDYMSARRLSAGWAQNNHNALEQFRLFLQQQRGQPGYTRQRPVNRARYCAGLPDWLVSQLERYQHLLQSHWRPARVHDQALRFWSYYTRLWRWLFAHYPIGAITDVRRQYLLDYVDDRLATRQSVKTINQDLRHFRGFLLYLQDQDYRVPQSLLHLSELKEPDRLPRFLTDEQVGRLRADFEQRVAETQSAAQNRNAQLDRAAFYLLWQSGLRLGEVEELSLGDLDLPGRNLMVRQGKGLKDRTAYLTDSTVRALRAYLAVRGLGATEHVFLYRHRPVSKDLIHSHFSSIGKCLGIHLSPHRLRHTMATQLLNAGCPVTTIQKLLGHRRLNTTMVYARVHDRTVSDDYYTAMAHIERSLDLAVPTETTGERLNEAANATAPLLALLNQLAEPKLNRPARLELVEQMRQLLAVTPGMVSVLQSSQPGGG